MKTIEEKAKAYDSIIEKANKMHSENCDACKTCIEELIPELAESEDEKIRKALIGELNTYFDKDTKIDGFSIERIIAWLEKQSSITKLSEEEQKPEENKGNIGGISSNWSEEDEHRIKDTIYFLDTAKKHYASTEELDACIDWLKSLQDRVQPQPKQEWSEEDKRKIDRIYSILRQAADTHAFSTTCRLIGDKECIELQDFLKSLRPQNHWKPSDEQLRALKHAFNDGSITFAEMEILATLYEGLKFII